MKRHLGAFNVILLTLSLWLLSGSPAYGWAPDSLFVGDPATRAVYTIINGARQLVPDSATLAAMGFDESDVRWLTSYMVGQIPTGPNFLPLRRGDLVRDAESQNRFLLDGGKWEIDDPEALFACGWQDRPERVLPTGLIMAIPSLGSLPSLYAGDLIRVEETGCFYLLGQGKHWIADESAIEALGLDPEQAHLLGSSLVSLICDGDVLPSLQNGSLLGSGEADDGRVYVLDRGKHFIPDPATFEAYGWDAGRIVRLPPAILDAIPEGAPLLSMIRGENLFTYDNWGQCTWYVAERREPPSWRSAKYWFGDAQASGYAVGQTPMPGAILVYDGGKGRGIHGHVAYVETVYSDGSFVRADSNICGWDCVRTRVTDLEDEVGVLGFVYWRYAR